MSEIILTGILNITPDSFSDGGKYLALQSALQQTEKLVSEGAKLVDIGADSTRPGSKCVGPKEEWNRLESILPEIVKLSPFSVDTHHSGVAHSAIQCGATMINDVTAGSDPEMFPVIGESGVRYVMMYSRCSPPHEFLPEPEGAIIDLVKNFFEKKIKVATDAGVKEEQLILDPGMGKFISDNPEVSWEVIRRFHELTSFGLPLYFGSSRKGFLRLPGESDILERDHLSAFTGALVARSVAGEVPLYIRCHNVSLQQKMLESRALPGRSSKNS